MKLIIVGGGPAGSQAAELAASKGARVILYEARPGWEKPCGGGVPERGVDLCPALADAGLPQRIAVRARIFSPSGREALVPLAEPLRVFSRCDLNRILLERAAGAGTEVRREKVVAVFRRDQAWEVTDGAGRKEQGDFLIGADGASGLVRSRVAPHLPRLDGSIGIGYFLEGYSSDEIILKFYDGLDGYAWIFPRRDHLAAGICGDGAGGNSQPLFEQMERFLIDFYGAQILRHTVRYGAKIPSLPSSLKVEDSCLGKGWALTGDAAGFVDPLTREGIHYALLSSRFLSQALERDDPAAYPRACAAAFGDEMAWARDHRGAFFARRFCEAFTLLASASRPIQAVVSDLIAGRQEYRSLRHRLGARVVASGLGLGLGLLRRLVVPDGAPSPSHYPIGPTASGASL
ncbi:MAG TPA: NAD(P)/FAD-dependent oxidoreductase [Candidatus Polarisedimenticolia bacterium]|nr:NAD(P)/FAD-dependent oxidoreductase [Candidatus Polarisedimenticolia bacterium]